MIRINLLQESSTSGRRWLPEGLKDRNYGPWLLVLVLLGCGVFHWNLSAVREEQEVRLQALRQQSEALKEVRARVEQYQSQARELEERILAIEALRAQQKGPVRLMNSIIASVPPGNRLWLSHLNQRDGQVVIEGRAFDVPAIADFIAGLDGKPPFSRVELEYWEEDQASIKFKLSCRVEL